jgi:hypothetical protein
MHFAKDSNQRIGGFEMNSRKANLFSLNGRVNIDSPEFITKYIG